MQYTITKNSAGNVIRCASYSDLPAVLADGETECKASDYQTAYTALMNPPLTMVQQAASALTTARAYVANTYTMLNEATPDIWVTYLKALMAIANGTGTTSTELPTRPAT